MHFDSFSDLLHMGGYGAYVWSSFGITAFALILLVVHSLMMNKKIIKDVRDKQARQARIEAAKDLENTL